MITTVCKISYGSQTVPPIVPAVQGDTGRAISFEIADFTPPAGATATYFILKPSGEAIYNSATITDNSILCELTAQSLAEAGENRMQVRVLQGEDIVTSFEVILMVRTFLGDDAMESGTEMNIFDQAVEQATEQFQENAEQIVEEVIESIPSDYTALTEEVDELNERLSQLINYGNATYSAQGYHNLEYPLKNGESYKIKITSSATNAAVSVMNPSGTQLIAVYVGETSYTATEDVDYLRLYFNTSTEIIFEIWEKGLAIDEAKEDLQEQIDTINTVLGYAEASYATQGYHNLAYNLEAGNQYKMTVQTATSNPSFAVSVMDNNSNQLTVVYNGQTVYFNADTDIPSLRLYFNANTKATFTIMKKRNMIAEFVVPKKICSVVGKQLNIQHNNILRYFDARKAQIVNFGYAIIKYFDKFSRFVGTSGQADFQAKAQLYYENTFDPDVTSQYITFHTVSASAGSGTTKKVLLIGDSLTDADATTGELINLFSDDVMDIELIGTLGTAPNLNEGRAGWRAYTYDKCAQGSDDVATLGYTNPFYNPTTQKFDFEYYMTENNFSSVDYVFICLGTNDIGAANHNTDTEIISYYNDMITSIHAYDSNIKIGLWLPPTRALYANTNKRGIDASLRMNKLLINTYSNSESNKIYLVPVYINLDPYHDYTSQTVYVNDRDTTHTMEIVNDAVHPAIIGYEHIADVIYSYIKYFAE